MAKVIWRARATRQLDAIADYLRDRNPRAALQYASDLRDACDSLTKFPEMGRRYDERYRVIVFRNHLILYRYDVLRDHVLISVILDGRRDISVLLDSEREGEN